VRPAGCPQAGEGDLSTNPFRNVLGTGTGVTKRSKAKRQIASEIEDCLVLNVHVSGKPNPSTKMPVVFYIHGGGYVSLSTLGMDGADLVREAGGGIVAVEVEYRLGIFGFLPGAEVKKKGALNAGLLDQQFGMQWVQKFIHLFGGDPNQVTVWGQSAGAGSVLQHLVAHGGNTQPPLFHRAMTSSTFLPNQYNFDDKVPEFLYSETVSLAGCSDTKDPFACLVAADAGLLETVNTQVCGNGFSDSFLLVPVVDGELIVERPIETILKGKLNSNILLTMTNSDEGSIFINSNFTSEMTVEQYVAGLMPTFNEAQVQKVANMYKGIGLDTVFAQADAIMGESIFVCPTYTLLNSFKGTARKGFFAIPPGIHGSDVDFYFPDGGTPDFVNPVFDASFAGAFTGVIKFGDPNVHPIKTIITPEWPEFKSGEPGVEMLFNRTEDFQPNIHSITTDPKLLARCEVWKSLASIIPQ